MRVIGLTLLLLTAAEVEANSICKALGQVESGDNDQAVGKAGEVSRYQIKPDLWRRYSGGLNRPSDWRNPWIAWLVATDILKERSDAFAQKRRRPPTAYELYVLWNAPRQLETRVTKTVSERARRFANLVQKYEHESTRLVSR